MRSLEYRSGRVMDHNIKAVAKVRLDWVRDPRPNAVGLVGMLGEVRIFTISHEGSGNAWQIVTTLPGSPVGRGKERYANPLVAQARAKKTLENWLTKAGIAADVVTNC